MTPSPFAELTFLAHEDARLVGAVKETEVEVARLLRVALRGPSKGNLRELREGRATPGVVVGSELYRGYTRHPLTRKVRNHLKRKLASDLGFFLYSLDHLGYSAPLVRAGLEHHFVALLRAPITSDAYLTFVDLSNAVRALDEPHRQAAALLARGFTPAEIGAQLGVNGPDAVSTAMRLISSLLEGRREQA